MKLNEDRNGEMELLLFKTSTQVIKTSFYVKD